MNLTSVFSGTSHTTGHNAGPLAYIWTSAPAWVFAIFFFVVALGALVAKVQPLAKVVIFLSRPVMEPFKRASADEQSRIRMRQRFARHVAAQLNVLAYNEDWGDDRFAELEAEVEVEGHRRIIRWIRHSPKRKVSLRREKSLSRALARTTDSLVILEGEPGSGKSVALRHLAEQLAREAQQSRSVTSLIPLSINMKEFRAIKRPVDADAVRDFILESLTQSNDREVERFLEDEFDRGMREGSWLLLLDSFDEIPDVLSSTESDNAVMEYALAINSFFSGMRASRAVVASREFRGPKAFHAPRFRIVELTKEQQNDLIERSGLKLSEQGTILAGLAIADSQVQQMAKNPMFLGLVCEYVLRTGTFPPNSHSAYDSYLEQRLRGDADRIEKRYGIRPDLVRPFAEEIAFCMADTEGLGLSPSRLELRSAVAAAGSLSVAPLDKVLDVLEYTRLGHAVDDPTGGGRTHFTFAHRRFQEYFATRAVLRAPDRVSAGDLMTNGRWRETAVTLLQTQPPETTTGLLEESRRLLTPMIQAVTQESGDESQPFAWPAGCRHILQLWDAGLGRAPGNIPADLRSGIGRLLRTAWESGRRHDRKWAVSFALVADRETTVWLLDQAFASGSTYLAGAAFTCVSRLADPPTSLYSGVRRTLIDMAASGQLSVDRIALKAQISRLSAPSPLLRVLRLLTAAQTIYLLIAALILAGDAVFFRQVLEFDVPLLLLAAPSFRFWFSSYEDFLNGISTDVTIMRTVLLYVSILSNFTVPIAIISCAYSYHYYSIPEVFILFMSLYFSFWPITVVDACRNGYATKVSTWLLIPFYAFRHLIKVVGELNRKRWTNFVGVSLIIPAAGYLLVVLMKFLWRALAGVIVIVLGSIVAALLVWALDSLVSYLRIWLSDRKVIQGMAQRGREIDGGCPT